ncbi:beta-propeller fold lactonase family protein [filamentous cyanobacterium LEGE 11480]|uniref:Beta-propeller fold lactonase family protein n=1 Tax=Romeriopsis navalis LEGE 11480 TaxID=2777977 RepID=A0A928VSI6_9CYAN|nr:lactonase family protein [Romeriopsis navalis]MBE9031750.1 beta-propeller fold lactonase family protein [Romeriopsis navalis LEGE 11480]
MQFKFLPLAVMGTVAFTTTAPMASHATPRQRRVETVFTSSNETSGNRILAFQEDRSGRLQLKYSIPTGGTGTGGGLGNQSAIKFSPGRRWLLSVNAGSNDVSVFDSWKGKLKLTDRVSSNGERPVSVAVQGNFVYVVNAGSNSVSGFRLNRFTGKLKPLPNSSRALSSDNTAPAQVSFTPNGRALIVTEKATQKIASFPIERNGYLGQATFNQSSGQTPFGFAFNRRGQLFVSEAAGGAPGASSLSSYNVRRQGRNRGQLTAITPSSPTNQTAACWVVITRNGRYAYTTNTGSGTITGYRINRRGQLSLLNPDGLTANTGEGSAPLDMALSRNNRELYVLNSGTNTIGAFDVNRDGSLTAKAGAEGLPQGSTGLAVR